MKRVLNTRPVAFLTFFLIAGIAIAYYAELPTTFSLPACLICTAGFLVLLFLQKKQVFILLYITIFFLGAFLFQSLFHTDFSAFTPNQSYQIQGYVSNRSKMNGKTHTYTLTNVIINEQEFGRNVILYTEEILEFGDTILFENQVTPPSQQRNPGDFDEQMYLAGKRAGFSVYQHSVQVIGNHLSWYQYPYLLRENLSEHINQIFSSESAPIAKAMFLGVQDEVTQEVRDTFAKTGIAHVLAISGLHIAILSYALNFLLKKCKMGRKPRLLLNIIFLALYAILTGFAPSILRTVLMTSFVLLSRWSFRKRDPLTFLSAALFITLLINATLLFSAGLLMSYGVVFGILCLNPPLNRLFKKMRLNKVKLDQSLSTSLSATAAVFPMTAYFFNNIALAAPISNFFAVPLSAIIVVFTGVGTFISLLSLQAGRILVFPAELSIRGLKWVNEWLAQTSFGYIEVVGFPVWACIICMAIVFLCSDYMLIRRKAKTIIAGALIGVSLLATCLMYYPSSPLKVVILDVGTGDAIHISAEGNDYLIDNGGNLQYSNINEYAEKNKIVFESVVVTNDKTKNLKELMKEGRINQLYVPENYQPKEYEVDCPMKEYEIYDRIILGEEIVLESIGTDGKYWSFVLRYNEKPICLFLQTDSKEVVFSEQVPILKPMGGGKKGTLSEEFIDTIQPEYAVISVKENNKKDLPDSALIDLLETYVTELFTTAEYGGIVITVSETLQIQTTK